ncbi:MAG: cheBR, partial [Actinobacteria bacterium]|nr:cheBR [Actinomycetota bacterium]
GIGASAGGLEALEQFLKNVPPRSGMAFVIVQHLDPTYKGVMPELLQRATGMEVFQVKDRMKVRPDCVYAIPPNKNMSILRGVLHLLDPVAPRGLRQPIDFFLRSLAEDKQELGVGVILSGMGSDGTMGLRAIKEKTGVVLVQDPATAKFDGMPRSAVNAGLADFVAPAEELPRMIVDYFRHTPLIKPRRVLEDIARGALGKILTLLRAQTGHDFSLYKKSTLYRRIERRMGLQQIDNIADYVRFLQENPQELEILFKELLIGVTSFFRDPEMWERLKTQVIPGLLASRPDGRVVRAWVPGCSTGEEAYSLAIVFREALDKFRPKGNFSLQIFATDLDRDAIGKARQGLFAANIAGDVSPDRLSRFFVKEGNSYRAGKEIREKIIFAPQNLVMEPPFTKLDILSCRNLIIYLEPELQKKLLPLFYYSLNRGGILVLGSAESVGGFTGLFAPLNGKSRIYRRIDDSAQAEPVEFPVTFFPAVPEHQPRVQKSSVNLQSQVDQLLLQRFSPASVLANDKGDILYIRGKTGKYLEPAAGKANWNIYAMAREGLRNALADAFQKALRQKSAVTRRNVKVENNGEVQAVDLTVQAIEEPEALKGTVMIVFSDVVASPGTKKAPGKASGRLKPEPVRGARAAELECELRQTREELLVAREEMQTSREELKSINEELQSANEELQSTNEELSTSAEEMQSMNEELQTVNAELQSRVEDLTRASSDIKNLLDSTDIATVFLDNELHVRRFTARATRIINLIQGDVGRPLADIVSNLLYPDLIEDAREVLRTLMFSGKQVMARDGSWFAVRILPYRTVENRIDGVVVTFSDITAAKTLEAELQGKESQLRQLTESLPHMFWSCLPEGACDYLSRQWIEYTGVPEPEQHGYGWLRQLHPEDRERVKAEWGAAVSSRTNFISMFRIRRKDGAYRSFRAHAVPIRDANGTLMKWYGSNTEIEVRMPAGKGAEKAHDSGEKKAGNS